MYAAEVLVEVPLLGEARVGVPLTCCIRAEERFLPTSEVSNR
jgi:hypothetical protein